MPKYVAPKPGARRYTVSTGTDWPGVSILGETESWIRSFYRGSTQNCPSRLMPETHWHVAGTLSSRPPPRWPSG